MDIFTTQLTRVVPVPIKPADLKVKALVKESPVGHLTDDPNHLENHESVVSSKNEQAKDEQSAAKHSADKHAADKEPNEAKETEAINKANKTNSDSEDDERNPPHLDIFV